MQTIKRRRKITDEELFRDFNFNMAEEGGAVKRRTGCIVSESLALGVINVTRGRYTRRVDKAIREKKTFHKMNLTEVVFEDFASVELFAKTLFDLKTEELRFDTLTILVNADPLKGNPFIKRICANCNPTSPIYGILPTLPNLRKFVYLYDEHFMNMFDSASLQVFVIGWERRLSRSIFSHPTILSLSKLVLTRVDDAVVLEIATKLLPSPQCLIKTLDLRYNQWFDLEPMQKLTHVIATEQNTRLEDLRLDVYIWNSHHVVSAKDYKHTASQLVIACCKRFKALTLDFAHAYLPDIMPLIREGKCLRKLSVKQCHCLYDCKQDEILQALVENKTIEHLDITLNISFEPLYKFNGTITSGSFNNGESTEFKQMCARNKKLYADMRARVLTFILCCKKRPNLVHKDIAGLIARKMWDKRGQVTILEEEEEQQEQQRECKRLKGAS